MKQYLSPEQTAKLIELGLPKPRHYSENKYFIIHVGFEVINYSIGELLKMLPKYIDDSDILHIESYDSIGWNVWYGCYCNGDEVIVRYSTENKELIDALYDMIIMLNRRE